MTDCPRNICTIVAKNYLAFARTLCDSFLTAHPGGKCHTLFIDEIGGFIDPAKERFLSYRLEEIGVPDIKELCFRYNVTELATAVKPFFLRHLLSKPEIGQILYLDPDILVLEPLEGLYGRLDRNDVVLTPHLDTDYPEDDKFPDDSHIMKSGIFNLGFIGVGRSGNSEAFLDWWAGKMREKCVIDHRRGYFVDQRFIDLAYTLFDNFHVEKGTGYNVAYWNLHSRRVEYDNDRWFCNGKPLHFFHFSNFKPEAPTLLSAFQDRLRLRDHPALERLFAIYVERLLRNGYTESRAWPYTYGKYEDGRPISDEDRRVYRSCGRQLVPGNPFDRRRYPIRLKAAMRVASFFGKLRGLARNRAMRSDGFARAAAKLIYGKFPTREP